MTRVLHLIRFDALARRVPLALWAAVLVIEGAFFYFGPFETPALPEFGRVTATLGLTMVRMLVSVVIIALLVHADPTVGTTAFWRSRPISRPALLLSKLVSAVLWLVVLPGFVTTLVLLLLGMNLADASAGGVITGYEQLVFVSMALALAIVTKDLVQFIVAAALGLGIVIGFNQAILPAAFSAWPALRTSLTYLPRADVAPVIIGLVAIVAVYQYLTLRRRYSIAMLAFAIVFASVAPRLGARSWVMPALPAAAPTHLVNPADVVLSAELDTQRVRDYPVLIDNTNVLRSQVSFETVISNEPEAIYLRMAEITGVIEYQDHSTTRWNGRWPMSSQTDPNVRATTSDQPYRGIRKALGYPELYIPPSTKGSSHRLTVSQIPPEQIKRHLGQPARLEANVAMLAYQPQVTAVLPLKAGSTTSIPGSGALSIESVSHTSNGIAVNGITVAVRETSLGSYDYAWFAPGWTVYALRNAKQRVAFLGGRSGGYGFASYTTFANTQVGTGVRSLFFSVSDTAADGSGVDDEWMKGAELVRLDMKLVGTVTRPLRIESFIIGGEQR